MKPVLMLVSCAVVTFLVLGCATAARAPSAEAPAFEVLGRNFEQEPDSLFKGDSYVLSDADIEKILAFKFSARERSRLAVLALGSDRYWSEDYAKLQAEYRKAFLSQLKAASGVANVSELPALLVPDKKTVPRLREAAARFQADLLVIYQSTVRTYSKNRALSKDEVKAQCVVDAVIVDVRTGIIPYSTSATDEVAATRAADDFNFAETIAKATAKSQGITMSKVGNDILAFLTRR